MGAVPLANIVAKLLLRFGPEGWNWIEHGIEHVPHAARQALPKPPVVDHWGDAGVKSMGASRSAPLTLTRHSPRGVALPLGGKPGSSRSGKGE